MNSASASNAIQFTSIWDTRSHSPVASSLRDLECAVVNVAMILPVLVAWPLTSEIMKPRSENLGRDKVLPFKISPHHNCTVRLKKI
nr:MAG TPA: hypothetical protein [Caudoviricetes sp.]